jgi:hypothetical protein
VRASRWAAEMGSSGTRCAPSSNHRSLAVWFGSPAVLTYGGGGMCSGTAHNNSPVDRSWMVASLLYTTSLKGPEPGLDTPLVNTRLLAASTTCSCPSGVSCRVQGGTGAVVGAGAAQPLPAPTAPVRVSWHDWSRVTAVRLSEDVMVALPVAVERVELPALSRPSVAVGTGKGDSV